MLEALSNKKNQGPYRYTKAYKSHLLPPAPYRKKPRGAALLLSPPGLKTKGSLATFALPLQSLPLPYPCNLFFYFVLLIFAQCALVLIISSASLALELGVCKCKSCFNTNFKF